MNIIVLSDFVLLRESIGLLIKDLSEDVTVLEASYVSCVDRIMASHDHIDLVIICLADSEGMRSTLSKLRKVYPSLSLVTLVDAESHDDIRFALHSGSQGLIFKSLPSRSMFNILRDVISGRNSNHDLQISKNDIDKPKPIEKTVPIKKFNLTSRQLEVLRLIQRGFSNKEIARIIRTTEGTVKIHCMAIYKKLVVTNRTQAAVIANDLFIGTTDYRDGELQNI